MYNIIESYNLKIKVNNSKIQKLDIKSLEILGCNNINFNYYYSDVIYFTMSKINYKKNVKTVLKLLK